MSKRVAIAVLISLVVIVAVFTSVQALGGVVRKVESRNAISMPVNNQALGKPGMNGLDSQYFNNGMDSGHDCGSDPTMDY
jgi:hypothetical protein